MMHRILVVDDDKKIANLIAVRLKKQGHDVTSVFNGSDAIQWIEKNSPSMVMLDIRLPDINGVDVLREIQKIRPETYVLMISAHADVRIAVESIKLGAFDFLEKPFEFPAFDAKVRQVLKQIELEKEVATLKRELGATYKFKSLVGSSPAMRKVYQAIDLAAKNDVTVLIEGESGTGKEMVARAIHHNSPDRDGPFVAVNCGAIPENLLESELFGHEKGSFTGAQTKKIGKFEQANGGTLFLDEIGDLPLMLQVKLLRVLQEKEIERVGGEKPIPVNVRIVTASHRNLKDMVRKGDFREDLYYRINVFPIHVPALRERKEDIPELFVHFLKKRREGKISVRTDEAALKALQEYDWPGNIRELENFADRLMVLSEDKNVITGKDIHAAGSFVGVKRDEEPGAPEAPKDRKKAIENTEKAILEEALMEANGNITKASKKVEMSRDTFYRKMKKYEISK